MSQPEISPLARRLAEENNVDWRGLHGSGAGGKVVERDVLEYLARVMAGEEDLDPTPEPVPEGMEAWPEQDVREFQDELRDSQRNVGLDEIQQELSAADRHGGAIDLDGAEAVPAATDDVVQDVPDDTADDVAEPLAEAGYVATGAPDDEVEAISEDIFLFDDDEEAAAATGSAAADMMAPPAAGSDGDDELLVAGEDGMPGEGARWDDDGLAGAGTLDGVSSAANDAAELQQEAPPTPQGLPDLFGAPEPADGAEAGGDEALFQGADAAASEPVEGDLEVPPLGDLGLDGAEAPAGEPAPFEERPWQPAEAAAEAADDVWGEPREPEPEPDSMAWAAEDAPPARPEAPQPQEPEPFEAAPMAEPPLDGGRAPVEPWRPGAEAMAAEAAAEAGAEGGSVEEAWSETAGREPEDTVALPGPLPVVSFGTLLRRHLDVTALAGAQLAVAMELGDGEPLSPGAFLLRAAAKAVAGDDWGPGAVSMVGWDEQGRLRFEAFPQAASQPFTELVQALSRSAGRVDDSVGDAALAVADMSALDVDEAVLAVDAPLLTLGRILYDNQRGSYRSTLSLAGDVSPERGGRLLARVAELLDAPVRLML